jgi:hypothetical protein
MTRSNPKGLTVEVFGNGCDAALIAGRLAEQGEVVSWYFNTPRWSARPQKIHSRTFRDLVGWLSEKGRRVDFLLTAPELEGWKIGEGTYSYDFPFLGSELSRWVNAQILFMELKQIAKELGVRMIETERFPAPDWTDSKFRILCCDDAPLVDWPKALFSGERRISRIEVCETIYPTDPLGPGIGRIYHFGSTMGLLEPQSVSESCLSLYDENSEAIGRCLRALQNPLSSAPSYLRALCMQNMGAKRKFSTLNYGRSRIDAPGIAMIGAAIGSLHPTAGLDLEYRLKQSTDFVDYFSKNREELASASHGFAETWNRKTEKRFNKHYKSSLMWAKGLRRLQFCRQTVATATLLPQFLRDALKSPL